MPVKINSYGGIITWYMRKHFSEYTSKAALMYASKKYEKSITGYIQKFNVSDTIPLFKMVNIETINRCNGTCSFCPANVKEETRKLKRMDQSVFERIIEELKKMDWGGVGGQVFLNINNEPLLDKEIVRRAKLLKMQLGSNVTVSMFTNGTLLSIDKLEALADSIDELIINNYSMQYRLNERNREIFNFVKKYPDKFQNMNIVINRRYTYEILATRAGNAPNKRKKNNNIVSPCIYPYTDLTIFPDGTVGLCCNDCYEVTNYGNIKENSLKEIWGNDKFKRARELMAGGRQYLSFCQECDVVDTGFRERLIKET